MLIKKLNNDLKEENPNFTRTKNNFREFLDQYGSHEGATKDGIAQRSKQLPFDDRLAIKQLAKKAKADHGIQSKNKTYKSCIETLSHYSKRQA